jgi:hypothetical protein
MYYHPVFSFVLGCLLVSAIQAVVYAFVAVVSNCTSLKRLAI